MSTNPLQQPYDLPPYSRIAAEHVEPAIRAVLAENLRALAQLLPGQLENPTWDGLVKPLEDMQQRLLAILRPIGTLSAEAGGEALEWAYENCAADITSYEVSLMQNATLFGILQKLSLSPEAADFDETRQTALANLLRDARLAGVGFESKVRNRCLALKLEIQTLFGRFRSNMDNARQQWDKHITDEQALSGLPEPEKRVLADQARLQAKPGWLMTLDFPSVLAVLKQADNRSLRAEVYTAFYTQASDQGPRAGEYDNGPVIERILAARLELANVLGHESYAQRALATRMFEAPDEVEAFLQALLEKVQPAARRELESLTQYAVSLGADDLKPWDLDYYKERYRQAHHGVAEVKVREYFPVDSALKGLSALVEQLFDVQMRERFGFESWHPDVRLFEVLEQGELLGYVYFDLFGRNGKRPGIWMEGLRDRHRFADGRLQLPIAHLSCDFSLASADNPSLLSLMQVKNLLHEFGHAMHHVLTTIDHGSVAGINGVAEDAVEFPSVLFERWARQPESVMQLSGHYRTGDQVPAEYLAKALAAQRAFQAMDLRDQLEFSLVDYALHTQRESPVVTPVVQQVMAKVEITPTLPTVRYTHTFEHLFAGEDYAAGYYTYVWSEVLAADLYVRFKREGVLSIGPGGELRDLILGLGGTWPAIELFESFTQRKPSINALLESMGIEP
jgi:oligopeptidase A